MVELELKDATIARLEEQLYAFEDEQQEGNNSRNNNNRGVDYSGNGSRGGGEIDNASARRGGGGSAEFGSLEGGSKEEDHNSSGAMAAVLARLAAAESLALAQVEWNHLCHSQALTPTWHKQHENSWVNPHCTIFHFPSIPLCFFRSMFYFRPKNWRPRANGSLSSNQPMSAELVLILLFQLDFPLEVLLVLV